MPLHTPDETLTAKYGIIYHRRVAGGIRFIIHTLKACHLIVTGFYSSSDGRFVYSFAVHIHGIGERLHFAATKVLQTGRLPKTLTYKCGILYYRRVAGGIRQIGRRFRQANGAD